MSHILRLRGSPALSAFRLDRLLKTASAAVPRVSRIDAEFRHFVQADRALRSDEEERLACVLEYGPARRPVEAEGELLLVVPRIGTISPWSSKASDIARHCGLVA